MKHSKQRDLILKIIRSTKCHPNADWIYVAARKEIPNISLGTVYRNLKLLVDEGKIQELCLKNNIKRYDGDLRDHYHVSCFNCHKVEDVPHISPRAKSDEIEELMNYQIIAHRLEFIGLCPDCQKKVKEKDEKYTRLEKLKPVKTRNFQ